MFNNQDKRKLYWLIDEYLKGNISESFLCDEFYYCYDLELDHNDLTQFEKQLFSELNSVISRYSDFEEDQKLDNNAFASKTELKQAILFANASIENNEK